MANRPYNPNTKYGRRKMREQALNNYNNSSPKERAQMDKIGCAIWAVALVIAALFGLLILATQGEKAFLRWVSH